MSEWETQWEEKLPPELEALIEAQRKQGVYFRKNTRPPDVHKVVAIVWAPGDPNKLAEAIIRKVDHTPMELILDGQKYMITKVPDE